MNSVFNSHAAVTAGHEQRKPVETNWVEKHRPREMTDVATANPAPSVIHDLCLKKQFLNVLLYGPPGTGKTTVAEIAARTLIGSNQPLFIQRLNASSERNVRMIRNQLCVFARSPLVNEIPFRLIILDEVDALPLESQLAVAELMDQTVNTARFVLICNRLSKISANLRGRCLCLPFLRLSTEQITQRMEKILQIEQVPWTPDALDYLVYASGGDLRRCVNIAEAVSLSREVQTCNPTTAAAVVVQPIEVQHVRRLEHSLLSKECEPVWENRLEMTPQVLLERIRHWLYVEPGAMISDLVHALYRCAYQDFQSGRLPAAQFSEMCQILYRTTMQFTAGVANDVLCFQLLAVLCLQPPRLFT